MKTTSKLAGYFAAHAVWSVRNGDTLNPLLAYSTKDNPRASDSLDGEDFVSAVQKGKQRLASNEMDADGAVLLYDARIPLDSKKVDAVIVEMRAYAFPDSHPVIAIPYTPNTADNFKVHKPKIVVWDNCERFSIEETMENFFAGVSEHEQGAAVWNDHLDESK